MTSIDVSQLRNKKLTGASQTKKSGATSTVGQFGKLTTSKATSTSTSTSVFTESSSKNTTSRVTGQFGLTTNTRTQGRNNNNDLASRLAGIGKATTNTQGTQLQQRLVGQVQDTQATFGNTSTGSAGGLDSAFTRASSSTNEIGIGDGMMDDKDFKAKGGKHQKQEEDDYGKLNKMHHQGGMDTGLGIHQNDDPHRGWGDERSTSVFGSGFGCQDDCSDGFVNGKAVHSNNVINAVMAAKTGNCNSSFRNQVTSDFNDVMKLGDDAIANLGTIGSTSGSSYDYTYSGSSSSGNTYVYESSGSSTGAAIAAAIGGLAVGVLGGIGLASAFGGNKSSSGSKTSSILGSSLSGTQGLTGTLGKEASSQLGIKELKTADVTGTLNANQSAIQKLTDADSTNYQEALRTANQQYAKNEQAITKQNQAVADANENEGKIQGEVATNETALNDTNENIEALDSSWYKFKSDAEEERDLATNLGKQAEKYGQEKESADAEITRTQESISTKRSTIQTNEGEISKIEADIAVKKKANANIRPDVKKAAEEGIAELEQQRDKIKQENQKLQQEIEAEEKKQGEAQTKSTKYSEMKKQAETDKAEAESLAEKFNGNKEEVEDAKAKKEQQLAKLKAKSQSLDTSLQSNKQALQVAQANTAKVTQDRNSLITAQENLYNRMNATDALYNKDRCGNYQVEKTSSESAKTTKIKDSDNGSNTEIKAEDGTTLTEKDGKLQITQNGKTEDFTGVTKEGTYYKDGEPANNAWVNNQYCINGAPANGVYDDTYYENGHESMGPDSDGVYYDEYGKKITNSYDEHSQKWIGADGKPGEHVEGGTYYNKSGDEDTKTEIKRLVDSYEYAKNIDTLKNWNADKTTFIDAHKDEIMSAVNKKATSQLYNILDNRG